MTESAPPRLYILGLGAIGGLLAAHLCKVLPLTLILRKPPTLADENAGEGTLNLCWQPLNGKRPREMLELKWSTVDAIAHPIDTLFITTKSYQVESAIEQVRAILAEDTRIVMMQNGLGSQHRLMEQLPKKQIYAATTTEGANIRETANRRLWLHAGKGKTHLGPLTNAAKQRSCTDIVSWLNNAGLDCEFAGNIMQALWNKLCINCGINPFTALLNCPNGRIIEAELFRSKIAALSEELAFASSHAGFPQQSAQIERQIRQVAEKTAENISSMLQDIRAGRKTEIDAINGFAWRYAEQYGLPYTVNKDLTEKVRRISQPAI